MTDDELVESTLNHGRRWGPAEIERLSVDDAAVLKAFLAQQQVAVQLAQAPLSVLSMHLAEKYGLTAQDKLHPDGRIERISRPSVVSADDPSTTNGD